MALPTVEEMEVYIRQAAKARGIDPDAAVRVAKTEGLRKDTWQSNFVKNGKREPSYGPFQLYTGGGLGNDMQKATGLDPSNPNNWRQGVDYALNHASKKGWGSWYGARDNGILNNYGIGGKPVKSPIMAMASPAPAQAPVNPIPDTSRPPPVAPSQQGNPFTDFKDKLLAPISNDPNDPRKGMIQALMEGGQKMATPSARPPIPQNFAVPAAPPTMLDPDAGSEDPRLAAILRALQAQAV